MLLDDNRVIIELNLIAFLKYYLSFEGLQKSFKICEYGSSIFVILKSCNTCNLKYMLFEDIT